MSRKRVFLVFVLLPRLFLSEFEFFVAADFYFLHISESPASAALRIPVWPHSRFFIFNFEFLIPPSSQHGECRPTAGLLAQTGCVRSPTHSGSLCSARSIYRTRHRARANERRILAGNARWKKPARRL